MRKKTIILGRTSATLQGGQTKKVAVSLNGTGKHQLKTHHNALKVKLTVSQSGKAIFIRWLKLKPPVKKHVAATLTL